MPAHAVAGSAAKPIVSLRRPAPLGHLVRIPSTLRKLGLDDLQAHGVPAAARTALVALLADLPAQPTAADDAALVGPAEWTLPCLVVLARHVGQGLRDHNVALLHEKARLRRERKKLLFLSAGEAIAVDAAPLEREAVLFLHALGGVPSPLLGRVLGRRADLGLATFVATSRTDTVPPGWRVVDLRA